MACGVDPTVGFIHTLDGVRVTIAANVNDVPSARRALEQGARSIGLLRSEGLCGASGQPNEDDFFTVYREVLELMHGGRVVARVCDFGGDNRPDWLSLPQEANPQMGFRSIRVLLSRPELFMPQLRALLRASMYGKLAILLPMVSSADEVLRARQLLDEVRAQLAAESIPVARGVELGVMVETPAAALICDLLARYVDFFCIGAHTLTQFTLVTDRSSLLYTPGEAHSTAVLRLVLSAVEHGHRYNVWTGVIDSSAADPALIPLLLALGVTVFSVEPGQLALAREAVRQTDISTLRGPLLEQLSPNLFHFVQ